MTTFLLADVTNHRLRNVTIGGNINAETITYPSHKSLSSPYGLCSDVNGDFYICDNGNSFVYQVPPSLVATIICGNGAGTIPCPAITAAIGPQCIASDATGNLYISTSSPSVGVAAINMAATTQTILNVSIPSGGIAWVAGGGSSGFSGDGGQATSAKLSSPIGVAVDLHGNLFICDVNNYRIRKVATTGIITTVAGNGSGPYSYTGDGGAATSAGIGNYCNGIACDASGNIYFIGQSSFFDPTPYSWVRCVNMQGTTQTILNVSIGSGDIQTVAGGFGTGYSGDSGQATSAKLGYGNFAIAIDGSGNLLIADSPNFRIREVATTGIITTVAGTGVSGNTGNGGLATSGTFGAVQGLALSPPPPPPPPPIVSPLSGLVNKVWGFTPAEGDGSTGMGSSQEALSITATGSWTATSTTGLVIITPSSGTGNATAIVTLNPQAVKNLPVGYHGRIRTGNYKDTVIVTSAGGSTDVPIVAGFGYGDSLDPVLSPNGNPLISHGMVVHPPPS
jgi:hypothetical protein